MNVEYDLTPLQDFFREQATPKEVVSACYRLIANYARAVGVEHFEEMQDDISFLSFFARYIDFVSEVKGQPQKAQDGSNI